MKQQNYIPFWKIIAKYFFTELPESGKANWQNPMQSTIKSITQTSCILNMPEIYINLLRIWILLMIYLKMPKKNVSENTTVSFVL